MSLCWKISNGSHSWARYSLLLLQIHAIHCLPQGRPLSTPWLWPPLGCGQGEALEKVRGLEERSLGHSSSVASLLGKTSFMGPVQLQSLTLCWHHLGILINFWTSGLFLFFILHWALLVTSPVLLSGHTLWRRCPFTALFLSETPFLWIQPPGSSTCLSTCLSSTGGDDSFLQLPVLGSVAIPCAFSLALPTLDTVSSLNLLPPFQEC